MICLILRHLFKNATGSDFQSARSQSGISVIETIISLPILLVIGTATIELSRYVRQHISASQIAYEGARLASSWPGLVRIINNTKSVDDGTRDQIIDKVLVLANRKNITNITVGLDYSQDTSANGSLASNSVILQVDIPYKPIFNLWGHNNIHSQASLAYLYPET